VVIFIKIFINFIELQEHMSSQPPPSTLRVYVLEYGEDTRSPIPVKYKQQVKSEMLNWRWLCKMWLHSHT
jgi:hypothetical protein